MSPERSNTYLILWRALGTAGVVVEHEIRIEKEEVKALFQSL
jgi:hypothetical protein